MIIKIQYNIAIFEENYKKDNVPLLSNYAFLAIFKKKNLYGKQNAKIKKIYLIEVMALTLFRD